MLQLIYQIMRPMVNHFPDGPKTTFPSLNLHISFLFIYQTFRNFFKIIFCSTYHKNTRLSIFYHSTNYVLYAEALPVAVFPALPVAQVQQVGAGERLVEVLGVVFVGKEHSL